MKGAFWTAWELFLDGVDAAAEFIARHPRSMLAVIVFLFFWGFVA